MPEARTTFPTPIASAARGMLRLGPEPFDAERVQRELAGTDGRAGAIVLFTGVVRADATPNGADRVAALEFECFAEMATPELQRVREAALDRFDLTGLTIVHRTGRLAVGDPIVLVGAAAAHRPAAFDAAAWTMDEVKRRVPLWKREISEAGDSRWVPADDCHCAT